MNIRKKSVDSNGSGQNEAVEEIFTGFLVKSPPPAHFRKKISWKRRFFVLAKTSDGSHELTYYRNTIRQKPIKTIQASTITSIDVNPTSHSACEWMSKSLMCSPSSVLLMKAEDPLSKVQREYFFIGESSEDADKWLNAVKEVMKSSETESENKQEITTESKTTDQTPSDNVTTKPESQTKPEITPESNTTDNNGTEVVNPPPLPPRKKSTCEKVTNQDDQCSHESSESTSEVYDNVVIIKTLNETAEGNYEEMSPRDSGIEQSDDSLLDCVTKLFSNLKSQEISTEPDQNKTHRKSETYTTVEKEISVRHQDLENVIFTEQTGKLCVSTCKDIQVSCLFHEGDQILAVNGLMTDTVEEIQTYLKKANKDEVKLTIRRLPGSTPLHSEPN